MKCPAMIHVPSGNSKKTTHDHPAAQPSSDQRISGSADQRVLLPSHHRISGSSDHRISGSADQRISESVDQRISGSADQRGSCAPYPPGTHACYAHTCTDSFDRRIDLACQSTCAWPQVVGSFSV